MLTLASLVFYASFDWRLLPLLVGMSALAWQGAKQLGARPAKPMLAALLGATFLPLLGWKVLDASRGGPVFPLGLSFFTFHCASYMIDSYRGTAKPEPRFLRVLLYVAFFPQLVAGPITRAREIFPQFDRLARPSREEAERAAWRIYVGLFKKFTIANVIGACALEVFREPQIYQWKLVAVALLFARYYIYADFSGYTDIAIGSARLLGIRLPENFQRPFAASSIADYWRRWHMTLSAWIRDYVFYPLVSTPLAKGGAYPLVVLTFLLLGLWHGLTVNFLLYGLWHGVFVVLHDATRKQRQAVWRGLGIESGIAANWIFPWFTFLFLLCPPTILFFAKSPADAFQLVGSLFNEQGRTYLKGVRWYHLATAQVSIILLELGQWLAARFDLYARLKALPAPVRWLAALLAAVWLMLAGEFSLEKGFLYFQF